MGFGMTQSTVYDYVLANHSIPLSHWDTTSLEAHLFRNIGSAETKLSPDGQRYESYFEVNRAFRQSIENWLKDKFGCL